MATATEAQRLNDELQALQPVLAELENIKHAPVRAARASWRAKSIKSRLERIAREEAAEREDPRWRAKLEEAHAELTAAVEAFHAITARRESVTTQELGKVTVNRPSLALQAAQQRATAARHRVHELEAWPDRLATAKPPRPPKVAARTEKVHGRDRTEVAVVVHGPGAQKVEPAEEPSEGRWGRRR